MQTRLSPGQQLLGRRSNNRPVGERSCRPCQTVSDHTADFGPDSEVAERPDNVRFLGYSGLVVRSAGRPARSRGCKSLAMKV
jgi:hypothetical protein